MTANVDARFRGHDVSGEGSRLIDSGPLHSPPDEPLDDESHREAALEAEVLLGHVLGRSRAQLLSAVRRTLSREDLLRYETVLARRLRGEPVAYIVGHREFFGLDFEVDPRVLVPRPETELLVEQALVEACRLGESGLRIADVGTGSGAVAISVAKSLPDAAVLAIDISAPALAVAARNCLRHGVTSNVTLLQGDLLGPVPGVVALVLANLPYVKPDDFAQLPIEVREHEPRLALLAEDDGLAVYRRLLAQLPAYLRPGGVFIAEIDPAQAATFIREVAAHLPGSDIAVKADYAGRERFLIARR